MDASARNINPGNHILSIIMVFFGILTYLNLAKLKFFTIVIRDHVPNARIQPKMGNKSMTTTKHRHQPDAMEC